MDSTENPPNIQQKRGDGNWEISETVEKKKRDNKCRLREAKRQVTTERLFNAVDLSTNSVYFIYAVMNLIQYYDKKLK